MILVLEHPVGRAGAGIHDQAWQRALAVSQCAGSLPPALGRPQRRLGRRDTVRTLALLITAAPVDWLAWRSAPWAQWTSRRYYQTVGTSRNGNFYGEPRSVRVTLRGSF